MKKANFLVSLETTSDDSKKPGTVVSQSLEAGYKYDAAKNNQIVLTYAIGDSIIIDPSLQGADLDDAIDYFEENNIKYKLEEIDEEVIKEVKDPKPNTVIKTEPAIGSSFEVNSDLEVTIYYFEGED